MALPGNSAVPAANRTDQPEAPSAAAQLTISPIKLAAGLQVPGQQAHALVKVTASLFGLIIMGVLAPAITIHEAHDVLSPGWTIFLVIIELVIATIAGVVPYLARN
jgi:uncharacterized membrane protein YhaH (DUF805 family)